MRAFVEYTALRLGLFVAALVLFRLLGAGGALLVLLAAFASFALSFVLLRSHRDRLSREISARVDPARPRPQGRFGRRLAQDAEAEDAAARARRQQE